MNINSFISRVTIFDTLTEVLQDFYVDVVKTDMMGVSDHAFLQHSLDMPYRTALEAFNHLKHCVAFKYKAPRVRIINSSEFVRGIPRSLPSRHVFVFNYQYDKDNEQIFVYDRESGELFYFDEIEEVQYTLISMFFGNKTKEGSN